MNVQQAIAQFLEHGQSERNLSDRTLRAHESDLSQFRGHLPDTSATEITSEDLETYLVKLDTGTYRDTSIRRKVAALKVFFRYLEDKGIVPESPARKLKIKKPVEVRLPTFLSPRETRDLLTAPKRQILALEKTPDDTPGGRNRIFCAVRDNVVLELLFSTGIRIGELVSLDVHDVNLEKKHIKISGKGTRARTVPLLREAASSMKRYLEIRGTRAVETDGLFVGRSGTRLTIYSIENIFKKHVLLARIKKHVTPHALRHTKAANLVSAGTDIHRIQALLGHASILSTQLYTKLTIEKGRVITPEELAERATLTILKKPDNEG